MLAVSREVLDDLRARISTIEKRPVLVDHLSSRPIGHGLVLSAPGQLQEIFADARRDAGSAFGFALGAARHLLTKERPALLIVQLMHESRDIGVPYGAGLMMFGIDPGAVVLARGETITEFLWAIEEAVGCAPVAAVIADVGRDYRELDFTASRRLSLNTTAGGSSIFLLRYGTERESTAANLRWRVVPARSGETAFDPRAPGNPSWHLELEKGRLGALQAPANLTLDWTENGFALANPQRRSAALPSGSALPRTLPAEVGYRLSEAS